MLKENNPKSAKNERNLKIVFKLKSGKLTTQMSIPPFWRGVGMNSFFGHL